MINSGSLMRATPPCARISAGTRYSAITADAPASSAMRACSAFTTSQITPPFSISGNARLTCTVPVSFCIITRLLACVSHLYPSYHKPIAPATANYKKTYQPCAAPECKGDPCSRPIRINPRKSSSPSVGARVEWSGWVGLYGRPCSPCPSAGNRWKHDRLWHPTSERPQGSPPHLLPILLHLPCNFL